MTDSGVIPAEPTKNPAVSTASLPGQPALVVLVGNPNVGKTTLFNRLTGQNARVGNYPGITVERREGDLRWPQESDRGRVQLVDVPGTYSLSARSAEEQIAINAVLGFTGNPRPDLAVVVVDAGQLVRNLYLVLQLVELEVPLVIALNMIDEASHNPPNPAALRRLFGVPCVATDARSGHGLDELRDAIARALDDPPRGHAKVDYPLPLRADVDSVADVLPEAWKKDVERDRALARWALTSIEEDDELLDIDPELRARCREVQETSKRDLDEEIIGSRYAFLDSHAPGLRQHVDHHPPKHKLSERVDKVLLHPVLGFASFILVMMLLFQALFAWADPMVGLIEAAFAWLQGLVQTYLPASIFTSLLSEGVIGGVGNVVVFLPQILLLFLFISVLEDSGYMARVAYLMDRIMRALGLHGRAFVPMLSGFACAVPAIMATRTMERQRDRLLTMMVIPLMTCSARLPVYALIIAALFPPTTVLGWIPVQGLLLLVMYIFSTGMTLLAAGVLGRTAIKGRRVPLILELPPYRMPSPTATLRVMWERSRLFLREAGTVILFCTVILWGLLSFPQSPAPTAGADASQKEVAAQQSTETSRAKQLENSYAGRVGKALEPALQPLGFDWKIGVGMIGAFAAREVFVSTMGLLYGIGEMDDEAAPLRERIRKEKYVDGRSVYTPLVGLSLMVFFALACQCMSTLAVVRRETRSWRWPTFMFAYMTGLAYLASLLVFQGGKLLGFS